MATSLRMGRPAKFDEQEILNAATLAFWRDGYTGTSMADLQAATGLNPGSIYNHFGSKKELFLRSLAFYIDEVVEQRITGELDRGEPLDGIEAFFSTAFESVPVQDLMGCLLTNTSLDREIDDKEIGQVVKNGVRKIERAIERRLKQAQDCGAIDRDVDLRATAIHFVSCFQGLCVTSRLTKDKKRLRVITEQAMKVLGNHAP